MSSDLFEVSRVTTPSLDDNLVHRYGFSQTTGLLQRDRQVVAGFVEVGFERDRVFEVGDRLGRILLVELDCPERGVGLMDRKCICDE